MSPFGMVASGIPEASRAGARMLEEGGNAIDAAVATAFAVGVVDPFNAGLGGQCYILLHLQDGRDIAVDASAPFPARTMPEELRPLKESGYVWGYKYVATPATPAALAYVLKRYGTMSLKEVLEPAIELAEFGFRFAPTTQTVAAYYADRLREDEYLAHTFLKDGRIPFPPDHLYCNPALADTLRRLATYGVEDFYSGRIATEIVADMAANGGYVSRLDLALLHVTERPPVRGSYRGLDVVAFPYPGGGDIVVDALQILDQFPPEVLREDTVDRLQLLIESVRLAFLNEHGSSSGPMLGNAFQDPIKAQREAVLIRFDRALDVDELWPEQNEWFHDRDTTQVSVMDRFGNAVALTQSLGYGSFVTSPRLGFQYNSLLESCNLCDPRSPSFPIPFRTVRTAMAPTILLCNGEPFLALGGAGSAKIPSTIVDVVSNVVDRGMRMRAAIVAPRVLANRSNPNKGPKACWSSSPSEPPEEKVSIEITPPITLDQANALAARGFSRQKRLLFPPDVHEWRSFGAVNAVMVDPATGEFVGAGDPRRQGGVAAPMHR